MQNIQGKSPRPNWLLAIPGRLIMKAWRFHVDGGFPPDPKFVIAAAPHTSNWDFLLLIGGASELGIKAYWMGKKELFPKPIGWFMKWLGGIPIDRKSRHNVVEQAVEVFNRSNYLFLVIPPEGTRSRTEYWKTGFYHIAMGAKVPIVLAAADYANRRIVIGPRLEPSGDLLADMKIIAAFYEGVVPKYPENFGPVRIKEQVAVEEEATAVAKPLHNA